MHALLFRCTLRSLRSPLRWAALSGVVCAALSLPGCASHPGPPPAALLNDALFPPPSQAIAADAVFALSAPMLAYIDKAVRPGATHGDVRRALIAALYDRGELQLRYDAEETLNAAQAFDARAGNCLSLVIMTAAFAKHLQLPVSYRDVLIDTLYTRSTGLTLASGHVNLVLGQAPRRELDPLASRVVGGVNEMTVDFLPPGDLGGWRSRALPERTIVAMYMNNRAAETLAQGRTADSYWWAREALRQDAGFHAAANTLAVVYERSGQPALAEAALRHVLAADADNTAALSNLAGLLRNGGRSAEADAVARRLLAVQPEPPFHFFDLGRQALAGGDAERAREFFLRELQRQPHQAEVHFWAAQAYFRLNDNARAVGHLQLAAKNSTTRGAQQAYAAKLDLLRARQLQ